MLGSARSAFMAQRQSGGGTLPAAIAAYAFSEGSGLTTADASGNGRTLTLNSASWSAGHTGSGLTNTAATSGAGALTFTAPTTAITMMAWIQPLDLTAGTTHFALGFLSVGGGSQVTFFTQRSDFGNPNVLQSDIRLGGTLVPVHGPALTVGAWTHVALTYDSTATTLVLYVNGSVVYSSNSTSGSISAGDEFRVAGTNSSDPQDTDVIIDDVRVFNVALTGAEVTLAMNTPVS